MNTENFILGSCLTYTGLSLSHAIERLRKVYDITTTTQDLINSDEVYEVDTPQLVTAGILTIDDDIFLNNRDMPVLAIYGLSLIHGGNISKCQADIDAWAKVSVEYKSKVFDSALQGKHRVQYSSAEDTYTLLGILPGNTYTL